MTRHRRELLADADGDVLEIGFGTGLNLPAYPAGVRKLTAIDPNAGTHALAVRRIRRAGVAVDHRMLSGERLPFDGEAFDCVVSTFTLCSIAGVGQALAEVYRVLRPGGGFLFLEHAISPEPAVRRWQRRLNWLEVRLAGGCRLDRDVRGLLTAQPFAAVRVDQFYLSGFPKTHGYMTRGVATK